MHFGLSFGGSHYEVTLHGGHRDLTMADVVAPYGGGEPIAVDGRSVAGDARFLETVAPGAVVAIGRDASGVTTSGGPRACQRVAFNRPPRREFPVALPALPAPSARPDPAPTVRLGWAALVVPVLLGAVLAVVIHPRMALFAVFSPAMVLANWIEQRRRTTHGKRRASEATTADRADFRSRLTTMAHAEARRRRRSHPSVDQLIAWVMDRDARLWERRIHHDDAMVLALGVACPKWTPELATGHAGPAPFVHTLVRELGALHDVPVTVSLAPGRIVGIAGDIMVRRAVARSLLIQTVALHGPSDLRLAVVTDEPERWDWCKWLPHVVVDADSGRRRLADMLDAVPDVIGDFIPVPDGSAAPEATGRIRSWDLLVVDVADITHPSLSPVREAIDRAAAGGGAALSLASSIRSLSSRTHTVIEVGADGTAVASTASEATEVADIAVWGATRHEARQVARRLAGVVDPDLGSAATEIPTRIRLIELLGFDVPTPNAVAARWARHAGTDPAVPVGATAAGVFSVSLVADGPHALLAGTTGSGKSEFLRSLVASLAASSHPDELTFVLVDYKGGSAFDVCSRLPHTVGLVTDLDGHLAQRALTCLEAELRYREEALRASGAADLPAYRSGGAPTALPRLFVVVDEFAALAKELPDFMAALIDIAQRGRSLGVHLLLATQRPQGVINDQIRANTNLRIALRVQDAADSVDVLGMRSAATIGRSQAGRGYVRLGAGEVEGFQTALVTGPATGMPDPQLVPFVFAAEQPQPAVAETDQLQPTDLEMLVDAVRGAFEHTRAASPRRPWLEPLAAEILLSDLASEAADGVALGLADEPSRQRQRVATWRPSDGNLLLCGVTGSGTSTALVTLAVSLARTYPPDDLHIYALDFDDQRLAPLGELRHCGGIVGPADRERQVRLIRMLQGAIERRRNVVAADPASLVDFPTIVLLVDNYGGFAGAFDDPSELAVKSAMARVIADGPGVGVVSIVTAKQPVDVPAQVSSLIPAKLLFRLADRYEYAGQGLTSVEPPTVPGRCYESWTGREIQIAQAHADGAAAAVALIENPLAIDRPVPVIGVLPDEVKVSQLVEAGSVFDTEWVLPIGIGDRDLVPVGFRLGEGDHVVISGPARAGKSTALMSVAAVAKSARPTLPIVAIAPRRSPLSDCPEVDVVAPTADAIAGWLDHHDALLVLVDDASLVEDVGGCLAGLADRPPPGVHVVAAAPADLLRSAYGHWTAGMRRSRIGLALKPTTATDGDLWQTPLPRRGPTHFPAGRGYLVADGVGELIQVAGA